MIILNYIHYNKMKKYDESDYSVYLSEEDVKNMDELQKLLKEKNEELSELTFIVEDKKERIRELKKTITRIRQKALHKVYLEKWIEREGRDVVMKKMRDSRRNKYIKKKDKKDKNNEKEQKVESNE